MSIDLNRVRRIFNQPEKLKAADFIYREIANRMAERLQLVRLNPHRILDAGCGRGADLSMLQTYYPQAHVIGLDMSYASLQQAYQEPSSLFHKIFLKKKRNSNWLLSDFGQLPLQGQSVDLVWSNLALHWHPNPDQVFGEWRRILTRDGLLMFSCFGPDTLKEIRHAFAQDNHQTPHTLSFVDMHDLGDMLVQTGFAMPVMDMEMITLTYASVAELLAEVRSLGGNPLSTRSKGLMGKEAWQKMCHRLEQSRDADGRIPLTLEVIYGHAFKPAERKSEPGVSVIHFDKLKK
jgi:malonyl-CoA O-methyltransferase